MQDFRRSLSTIADDLEAERPRLSPPARASLWILVVTQEAVWRDKAAAFNDRLASRAADAGVPAREDLYRGIAARHRRIGERIRRVLESGDVVTAALAGSVELGEYLDVLEQLEVRDR